MEQRNSEKNKKFLVLLMTNVFFFACWLLIPEQILWLDITLIRLDVFYTFTIIFMVLWDTSVKYMNNKFQVLTNMYVCTGYFIGFTFFENLVLFVKTTSLSGSFEFIKVSIIDNLWFLLENWCSENAVVRKLWKKIVEDQYF